MIKIDVWIRFSDGASMRAGEMICTVFDHRGHQEGAFRYTPDYLRHPNAFALDPISLPLTETEFETAASSGVFTVFEDSLPDNWGRPLLARKAGLSRGQQSIPNLLLAIGSNGLGALSFSLKDKPVDQNNCVPVSLLEKLLDQAEKYEKGEIRDDSELKHLFQAASSPGGSRPKALIKEGEKFWIAKFPSVKDDMAVENIEAATLSLARPAGLEAPEFQLVNVAGRDVLMVRRFDLTGAGGRLHMVSLQTLLRAEGWYNLGYRDLFDAIQRFSYQPEVDMPALFRQMVFNAVIGNTDDHLKNFMMIRDETGYRLSPAYDLLPDIHQRREHVLMFGHDHFVSSRAVFVRIGKNYGIPRAQETIDQVIAAVAGWREAFDQFAVPPEDARRLESSMEKRLRL